MSAPVFTPETLPPPSPGKKRYGVLGFPVSHSLSPVLQEAGFGALGIAAEYFRVEIPRENLAASIPRLRGNGFLGWNCTLPHKEVMAGLCDILDASARECGSVNTVRVSPKGLEGFSTDADGWEDAVAEAWKPDLSGMRILVLGCGGVGRTLAFRLARRGCLSLALANRTEAKARQLAGEIGKFRERPPSVIPWDPGALTRAAKESDLLIHATPLGLSPGDPFPFPEECLHPGLRVYDTVYHPKGTALLHRARSRGLPALDGLGMLLHQGARALTLWTGLAAPVGAMRSALERAVGRPL